MEDKTPWTSIDLYYKGFHVKKSLPDNVKLEDLKKTIDTYKEAGFEPSWNEDTNKSQDPIMKATRSFGPTKEGCQHPEDTLEKRVSHSEKNEGREYMRCTLCNSFVRWA